MSINQSTVEEAGEYLGAAAEQLETVSPRTCPDPMVDEALGNLYEAIDILEDEL